MIKHTTQTITRIKPYLPLIFIIGLMAAAYLVSSFFPLSKDPLMRWHEELVSFKQSHPIATPLLFMGTYIFFALLSLPGIFVLSLLSGYLFPQPLSSLYVLCASTIGAGLLYIIVRTAIGNIFFQKNNTLLQKMQKGFHQRGANYLLFLRLVPLFPFAIVNLAGAYFNVSFSTFLWTTFIGMIPSVFIYTQAGKSLMEILNQQAPLRAADFLSLDLILGLGSLALLMLLPLAWNYFQKYGILRK